MDSALNYIDGVFVEPRNGQFLDNVAPATGKIVGRIADSGPDDVSAAVDAARSAYPSWSSLTQGERSAHLLAVAGGIAARAEELARAESRDNGKPLSLARRIDIPRAEANIRFFATAILHDAEETHSMGSTALNYTLRHPLGVVGAISPWNLPLYLFTWKIAPAVAAGNCVVGKPSELTPMTAGLLGEICSEAGLPQGVLNIVQGAGARAGQAIVDHSDVCAVTFTGGTKTGATVATSAAAQFKKVSLELGGKNPTIVFGDCDFDRAVSTSIRAAFSNQGEICLCGSRIFVEKSIFERFREAFVAGVEDLRVGDPLEETTDIGALVSESHRDKVLSHIAIAIEEGGKILCGGLREEVAGRCHDGFFVQPTVIEGLGHLCQTNQEEIFGPVATLIPFETEDEVLHYANDNPYGLSASIWTTDLTRAHRVAAAIEAGIVWVNCWMVRDLRTPFGGVKQSGLGREGGYEALHFFTEPKNVCIRLDGG